MDVSKRDGMWLSSLYNLCKAIAPQKECISFISVQKANTVNGFIFTMAWCLSDEFRKKKFKKETYVGVS